MVNYKRMFFLGLFLSVSVLFAYGPDTLWTRTYGGRSHDWGYSIQETSDSGYIVVGNTYSFGVGESDVYLIKTDANGNDLWTKTFGDSGYDYGRSVQQTSDGGYIIAGWVYFYGSPYQENIYLIKTNSNGDTLWTKTYGGANRDLGHSVYELSKGGYIIAGHTKSFYAGNWDVYLLKTGENGNIVWTRTYGGTDDDYGYSVLESSDSSYVIAGYTRSFGVGGSDVYLVKTDGNGNTLWTKTYGNIDNEFGYSVQETSDRGYIIAGYRETFGEGERDVYLLKTDANGDTIWTKTYGGVKDDRSFSVKQTSDGGYIITGFTYSFSSGAYDVYLIKTDVNGDTLWTGNYGGLDWDFGYAVQQTSDGGYVVVGYTYSFGGGNEDVYLVKLASEIRVEEENYKGIKPIRVKVRPNPFYDHTTVEYVIQQNTIVEIVILDVMGRAIRKIWNGIEKKGSYKKVWDGRDEYGEKLKSGVYFLQFRTANMIESKKLLLLR